MRRLSGFTRKSRVHYQKGVWAASEIWKKKKQRKFKKRKGSHRRDGFKSLRKTASCGKANMANQKTMTPTTRRIGGKARQEGKKGQSKFQYPFDGNTGSPSYENGKGRERQIQLIAAVAGRETREASCHSAAGWSDQGWDASWRSEGGWYSSRDISSTGHAMWQSVMHFSSMRAKSRQRSLQHTTCQSPPITACWQPS